MHLLPGIFQAVQAVATRFRIKAIRLPKESLVKRGDCPSIVALWRRATITALAAVRVRPAAAGLFYPVRFWALRKADRSQRGISCGCFGALNQALQRLWFIQVFEIAPWRDGPCHGGMNENVK